MIQSYQDRANYTQNPIAKKLFLLMDQKQTNLCISADVQSAKELLTLAEQLGPEICLIKTHIDILNDFNRDVVNELSRLAEKHQFLIFEDRKFADIGNTVKQQYADGIYRIADWANITNAHILPGPGIIEGLKEVGLPKGNALLLLAQMSSKDNFLDEKYKNHCVELALQHPDFVIGFISQEKISDNPAFIYMTPGVQLETGTDNLGQQYLTPEIVIKEKHCDIIIVGRGIYHAKNPIQEAKKFRERGWAAYQQR